MLGRGADAVWGGTPPRPDPALPQTSPRSLTLRARGLLARLWRRALWTTGTTAGGAMAHLLEGHFDLAYYRARNPDVTACGADPLAHFLVYGWREGRDPAPDFSLADYLELNPDVAASGVNPFVHYVQTGRAEGRIAKRRLGWRHDVLARIIPMADRLAPPPGPRPAAAPAAALAQALSVSRSGLAELHLSFSHDDYAANLGGVQLGLKREAQALAERGVDHLHLFPAEPGPMMRATPGALLGALWNGTLIGVFAPEALAATLGAALAGKPPVGRSLALHSLLGHCSLDVLQILKAADLTAGLFWLHDFASLCAGFHLMRNDVADCAAPPPDSAGCAICLYGPYRGRQVAEHRRLFEALALTVVAPSQSALDLWLAASDLPHARAIVQPLARLGAAHPAAEPAPGPLRVAFLGLPAAHKGWPVFRDLALRFRDDPRYAFVQLGRRGVQDVELEFQEITVSAERPQAMRDAVEAQAIDVALIWPLCRETFSFTAYEALAAGAAILTHADTGNIAALAAEPGAGRVLSGETELAALFAGGEVLKLSRAERRPQPRELIYGALSADLRSPAPKRKRTRSVAQ